MNVLNNVKIALACFFFFSGIHTSRSMLVLGVDSPLYQLLGSDYYYFLLANTNTNELNN